MALVGPLLWGLSGTVAQDLFENEGFSSGWLVTMRLLVSGILLLLIRNFRKNPQEIWSAWKSVGITKLLIFGILGMLGVQYTYFAAIQTGNAATAALLQYMAPLFIIIYLAARYKKVPKIQEFLVMLLALLGILLLVTSGSTHELYVPIIAVVWGLISALALAFYTMYSSTLLEVLGADIIIGWGMVIGGIGLSVVSPPWNIQGQHWSIVSAMFVAFIVIFGTLISFYLYIESLRYITPTEASLLGSAEPLAATISSVIWLHVAFNTFQAIGALLVTTAVIMIALLKSDDKEEVECSN